MAFNIPDINDLAKRARNAFRGEMPGTDAWVWPNNVYVAAKVFAGQLWLLFARLKWVDKQRFMMTATIDGLLMHGAEFQIPRRGRSFALGYVDVPATYPFTVASETLFTRGDGVSYTVTQSVSALANSNSGIIRVPVVCNTSGKSGNCIPGTPLSTTLAGLTDDVSTVNVSDDGIGQGADIEPPETYRSRLLARKRQPPMGGAAYDYERWAKEISGVTRVFVAPNGFGPGTVAVWIMMDDTYLFGIPQPVDVETVQAHIDSVKPVTAGVAVFAPIAQAVDVTVKGVHPDTTKVRQAVAAEIASLFARMTRPGLPASTITSGSAITGPFTLYHSWIEGAVNNATGEDYNEGVTSPAADMTFDIGIIPVLRSVNFAP